MATIATHNGSVVHQAHNLRTKACVDAEPHIDPNGVHETWHHETIADAYHRLFDDAVEEYNARQPRADRQIKSYLANIRKDDKKHDAYEMIVGVYGDDATPEQKKEILREFVDGWRQRNPNLELIGAYYHADEPGGDHIHVDYVPVAHGYKKGMKTQTALVQAFKEMGIVKTGPLTAQIKWERRENEYLERLCNARGIHVEHPRIEGIEHKDKEAYIADQMARDAQKKLDKVQQELGKTQQDLGDVQQRLDDVQRELGGELAVRDFAQIVRNHVEPIMDEKLPEGEILAEKPGKPAIPIVRPKGAPATVTITREHYENLKARADAADIVRRGEKAAEVMDDHAREIVAAAREQNRSDKERHEVAVDARVRAAEGRAQDAEANAEKYRQMAETYGRESATLKTELQGYRDAAQFFPEVKDLVDKGRMCKEFARLRDAFSAAERFERRPDVSRDRRNRVEFLLGSGRWVGKREMLEYARDLAEDAGRPEMFCGAMERTLQRILDREREKYAGHGGAQDGDFSGR